MTSWPTWGSHRRLCPGPPWESPWGSQGRLGEARTKPDMLSLTQDLTGGAFEDNLRSLHLREGQDFLHFS